MQNVVFTETQGNLIAKITGRIMTDKQYKERLINDYFNCPQHLTIYQIYVLEFQIRKLGDVEFNLGYFDNLEQYAGDNLSYYTYQEYNDFIKKWNSDLMFKNAMRERFENNDIGNLPAAVIAAYELINNSENSARGR
jgi:hypothetical protein